MDSAKSNSRDLLEIAKDIFADSADPSVFESAYHPDGSTIKEFPSNAQKYVYEAREKFFRSGENEFHLNIALSPGHHFTSKAAITQDVINQIRPMFAAEYLKHIGSVNSTAAVKLVQKILPLTADNIEIHTRKNGYNTEQLIVNQNPKVYAKKSQSRTSMTNKCKKIRENFLTAWAQIDNNFPTETRKPLPRPFKPNASIKSMEMISKSKEKKKKCPTSIPKELLRNRKKPQIDPFIRAFPFILPRSEIESVVQAFSEKFDIDGYLDAGPKNAKDCIDFLRAGVCSRILYHVAKYMHATLVLNIEDYPDFIRARALWHIIYKKLDDSIVSYRFVSIALMMIKSCTFVLFDEHSTPTSFRDKKIVESTLFVMIDKFLNPFQIFDSLEKPEDYRATLTPIMLENGKPMLDDINTLVEKGMLKNDEEKIARLMTQPNGVPDLLCLLGAESWGDVAEYTGPRNRSRYNETRIVQKLIEMDIAKLNEKMPRTPPKWVKNESLTPRNKTKKSLFTVPSIDAFTP
ncbi:hypothetical protein TRFO_19647 [Tritrichomonas foetus]|uniref:Uncharacterized protein n=1 Tax=Tritrichomonas foetus TaxID=1144522 RepID=A0A1J4KJ28_9EUKA|nr:hypothetical protein TRFO_19647 [Tritrichomonas foetus]|eukprot:OHT10944.1 hypothetical protein TRFO_19647 [Tritrichomonas foetus]